MQIISSKKVNFLMTLSAAIIILIEFLLYTYIEDKALGLFISLVVLSVFMFTISRYLVRRFLYSKIRMLYKTIHDTQFIDREFVDKVKTINILDEAEKEVREWSEGRGSLVMQLKRQEEYRREFIGNVSHELRTPIFNIQGYILTLLDGGLEDENINRSYLERTEKSINRMIGIVKDLESISKLEYGELKLIPERFNIIESINEVVEMQEMRAQKHKMKVEFPQSNSVAKYVEADKKEIFQAMVNLLVNSIKYGKQGGKTQIEVMDMGDNFLIEFRDNGIGIEKDNLPRIFERFYRVDKSRSRNMGGSGLGLAIVKHIIDAHDQSINVSSTYGEGSSFTFTLNKATHT